MPMLSGSAVLMMTARSCGRRPPRAAATCATPAAPPASAPVSSHTNAQASATGRATSAARDDAQADRLGHVCGRGLRETDARDRLFDRGIALAVAAAFHDPHALDGAVVAHPDAYQYRVFALARLLVVAELRDDLGLE